MSRTKAIAEIAGQLVPDSPASARERLEAIDRFVEVMVDFTRQFPIAPLPVVLENQLENSSQPDKLHVFAAAGNTVVEDKRVITRDGVKFVPLSLAASLAQISETTLRSWISNPPIRGRDPIRTHVSTISSDVYVSRESVIKLAERFVRWPSEEPSGSVTLGETDDESGYFTLPVAANIIGVSSRTLWRWTTRGKAPTDKPLDIIKCTLTDYFYIRQADITYLRSIAPTPAHRPGPKRRSVTPIPGQP